MHDRDHYLSFTSYKASSSGWLLWEPRTTTSPARSVSSVTPAEPEPECPVVWRQWPADNDTIGAWAMSMSESADVDKAVDGDNSTVSISPSSKAYPYYQIDLGRGMRVTKVAILGGDNPDTHPMENLEVKVGNSSITGWDGNVKITSNTRFHRIFDSSNLQVTSQNLGVVFTMDPLRLLSNGLRLTVAFLKVFMVAL